MRFIAKSICSYMISVIFSFLYSMKYWLILFILFVSVVAAAQEKSFRPDPFSYEQRIAGEDTSYVFCDSLPTIEDRYAETDVYFSGLTRPPGKWKLFYENGKPAIEVNIKNGKMHGIVMTYHPYSPKEEMHFNEGRRLRTYRAWYNTGQINTEQLPDTVENRTAYRFWNWKGKLIKEGYFLYKMFDRISYIYDVDSVINYWNPDGIQQVVNGQGKIIANHSNGRISSEASYVNGKLEGPTYRWNSKGIKTYECHYREGKKYGHYYETNYSGVVQEEGYYKWGHMDSLWLYYYPDGKIARLETWLYGRKHGLFASWFPSGRLRTECNYWNNDFLMGDYCSWYENGVLEMDKRYQFDNSYGQEIYYDQKGRKTYECYKEWGALHWEKIYWKGILIRTRYAGGHEPVKKKKNPVVEDGEIPF
jgi:antitoxin component YwqK of YwqJK toxin-antitoxin module